jgi:hypothetical protein
MLEMTTESVIVIPAESFFHVTMSECCKCYSLQPCVSDAITYRCADWRACKIRQFENRQPTPIKLTDADVAGLLARMETQQADMERLRRIESAAVVVVQAIDALTSWRVSNAVPYSAVNTNLIEAEQALSAVVKQCAG